MTQGTQGAGPRPVRRAAGLTSSAVHRRVTTAPAASAVRLTRRGQAVVVVLLLGALLTSLSLHQASSDASSTTAPVMTPVQTTVHPGDTLWAVARRIAPELDQRDVVAQIEQLNDLHDSTLQVGQQLLVPRAA